MTVFFSYVIIVSRYEKDDNLIDTISIIGGCGKTGQTEPVDRVDLKMGDVVTVVGPTGSGKTTLINDLELFADGSTPTGRRVLINGGIPPREYSEDPSLNPIALITQNTSFLSDLPVNEFLSIHAGIRGSGDNGSEGVVRQAIDFANQLTGEPIGLNSRMTELSGGQARALLIADAAIISNTPIVLLDEIENAGINRTRAMELLREYRKIYVFVTHDPRIALLSDFRIVMRSGMMMKVIPASDEERQLSGWLCRIDDVLSDFRNKIRLGERLNVDGLEAIP